MQRKREIKYGKVIEYDGYNGVIKGVDGMNYLFSEADILNNVVVQLGDIVMFEKEGIQSVEIESLCIARFVKKLKKNYD